MNARMKATMEFQAPATKEPARDLSASLEDRERGARIEFTRWRTDNPNFTHNELLNNWKRIRVAWNISKPDKKKTRK